MRAKRICFSIMLLLVSVLTLAGCADIELIRTVDSNYVIMDKFVITLDKSSLGSNYDVVRASIVDDMTNYRNYVNDWIESFREDYIDEYEYLKDGILCETITDNDNELSVYIEFYEMECFAMFYGLATFEGVEGISKAMDDIGPFVTQILTQDYKTENMGLFLYKAALMSNQSMLSDLENCKIDEIGVNYYDKYTDMLGADNQDISLTQIFAYPDDRLYSNADEVEELDGFTFMLWDLTNKGKDFRMEAYKLAPRVVAWYVLALIISVAVICVAIVVIKYCIKKSNTKVLITKKEAERDE